MSTSAPRPGTYYLAQRARRCSLCGRRIPARSAYLKVDRGLGPVQVCYFCRRPDERPRLLGDELRLHYQEVRLRQPLATLQGEELPYLTEQLRDLSRRLLIAACGRELRGPARRVGIAARELADGLAAVTKLTTPHAEALELAQAELYRLDTLPAPPRADAHTSPATHQRLAQDHRLAFERAQERRRGLELDIQHAGTYLAEAYRWAAELLRRYHRELRSAVVHLSPYSLTQKTPPND